MNVHDAPHRRLGDPCCGAARKLGNSLLPQGEVGGKSSLSECDSELVEWQQFVLVRATVASARDVEGDAGGGFVDASDGGRPSCATEFLARVGWP